MGVPIAKTDSDISISIYKIKQSQHIFICTYYPLFSLTDASGITGDGIVRIDSDGDGNVYEFQKQYLLNDMV